MAKRFPPLLWLGAVLLSVSVAAAADRETVAMNFQDAEIEAVVKFISELTGKNFILDDKVRGKVTVISPTQLSPDEAFEVFQAILGVKGFTIVPAGKVLKILPQQDARQTNIETVEGTAPPGDRYVTQLVPLQYVDTETAVRVIDPLRSKNSSITPYPPTNTLIITDSYSNIERLLEIIASIDVETVDTVTEIIRLQNAAADIVAKTLQQAVAQQTGGIARRRTAARTARAVPAAPAAPGAAPAATDEPAKIIPDTRTNSLIVIADPETLREIKLMVEALDMSMPSGTGLINVVHLRYADAENVAAVLNSISKGASPTKPRVAGLPAGAPQTQTKGGEVSSAQFEEPVGITADKATNALVIVSTPQDFQTLRQVIEKLDVRRPQVLVEALVVEMSYTRGLELGVEWRTTTDPTSDGFNLVGGSNFGNMSSLAGLATNPLAGPTGMFLAAIDGTVKVGDTVFPNIGALLKALQEKGDVNVLSTPHLLTTDNEEAEIVVSNNIPFQTSEKFDTNGNPIFTFEYRDVGLTLRFTPQINDDDFVKLKLFQEISDVVETSTGGSTNAPSTTKRSAKTTVVMRDDTTVVIGGLIQDGRKAVQSAVPCLGDIPLLGALFRSRHTSKDKTNLMIFLTPHIVREARDLEAITKKKRSDHEKFMEEQFEIFGEKSVLERADELLGNPKPEEPSVPLQEPAK